MAMSSIVKLLSLLLWLTIPVSVKAYLARPGCNDTCGGVTIPFPFGIGSNCSLNEWYSIKCLEIDNSFTPRLWINGSSISVRVLNISLASRTITVETVHFRSCQTGDLELVGVTGYGLNLTGSPFFISKEDNKFILFGCGNSLLSQHGKILSGCMSMCVDEMPKVDSCYGIGCCETSVPYYLSHYDTNFTSEGFKYKVNYENFCILTFVAERNWAPEILFYNFNGSSDSFFVPVVLTWTIPDSYYHAISACKPRNSSIQLESAEIQRTWICPCNSFKIQDPKINPYLDGQCFESAKEKKDWKAVIVGITTSLGVSLLVAATLTLYNFLKRRRNRMIKEKFFKRNGGLLLQKQLSGNDSIIENTRIFTAVQLEKATDNFNENLILGRGGQGTVYKGMLTDGRIVAIKKSKRVDESQLQQFINEVVVLSQVVHKNVLKLLGCCLETEVPLLVYEFVANGTLYDLIHNETDEILSWNIRLRIATEVALALAYLHTAVSIPIYHRDIKSSNILLDEKYTAKVSDFGTSKSIAIDKTHITTLVRGTFGYLDPQYFQSSQFTEKSDVYSFGVVLAELLTKQKAVSLGPGGDEEGNMSLVGRFLESMEQNVLDRIVDPQILDQSNKEEIIAVAKLAERCLNLNGKKRPTMSVVAMELERIRLSRIQPTVEANFQSLRRIEEETGAFSDASPTSTGRTESSSSSFVSETQPLRYSSTI